MTESLRFRVLSDAPREQVSYEVGGDVLSIVDIPQDSLLDNTYRVLPKHSMTAHLERAKQVIGHRAHTGAGAGSTRSAGRARQTNAPALQECALTVRAWLVHILQVRAPELFARSHAPHGTHK